jgi:hypothetical protein
MGHGSGINRTRIRRVAAAHARIVPQPRFAVWGVPIPRVVKPCKTRAANSRSVSCKLHATTAKRFCDTLSRGKEAAMQGSRQIEALLLRHAVAWLPCNDARVVPNRSASYVTRCRVATQLQHPWQESHVATKTRGNNTDTLLQPKHVATQ